MGRGAIIFLDGIALDSKWTMFLSSYGGGLARLGELEWFFERHVIYFKKFDSSKTVSMQCFHVIHPT